MLIQPSGAFPQIRRPAVTEPRGEIPVGPEKSPIHRVLVIDDEPLVLWSISEMLRSIGMEVEEAETAKGALRAFTADGTPPDVVLLDLKLPDSADLGLLSILRHISPKTRVILMTAFGSPEVYDEARRLGAFAVIDKPFDLDDLRDLLLIPAQ